MRIIDKQKINNVSQILFFNRPIFQYERSEQKRRNISHIKFFPKSFEHKVLDEILKTTGSQHDYIFLIRAGLGEAYLLNFMIDEIIQKNNIKNPCFVCHRKQYQNMFKLYHPQIPCYHINLDTRTAFPVLKHRHVKYKNHKFNINPSTLKEIQNVLINYEKGLDSRLYVDVIKGFNKIDEFKFIKPVFGDEVEKSVFEKTKNLDKGNFIFIIKEANFIKPLEQNFWDDMILKLKSQGYDVYVNDGSLSLDEAFYLATLSKGIIGLRCGFSELLSTVDAPKHIICTACKYHDIRNLQEILSLKSYPFVNSSSVFEYNALEQDIENIKKEIIEKFKLNVGRN